MGPHGAPIAGATAFFREHRPFGSSGSVVTDSTGTYRVRLRPGVYTVAISAPNGYALRPDSVRIGHGQVELHHRLTGLLVRIRVLGADGLPLGGGALHFDAHPYFGGAYMDTEGFSHVRLVAGEADVILPRPGPYLLYASRDVSEYPGLGSWTMFRTDSLARDTTLVFQLK